MYNFTLKRTGLTLALALGIGLGAAAQTFLADGVCYQASGNTLKILSISGSKKPTPENGTLPECYSGDIVIPEVVSYNGVDYTVVEIATTAFKSSQITSFKFSSTITKCGKGAFQDCQQLTTVVFSTGLTTMAQNMFTDCTALSEMSIPSCFERLPTSIFKGCTNLAKLTIEESDQPFDMDASAFNLTSDQVHPVQEFCLYRPLNPAVATAMADKPFRGSPTLQHVVIGGKATELSASYFEGCTNLSDVTFEGDCFTTLGTNVFANTGLTKIILPETVTHIPSGLFASAKQLVMVGLGSAVTSIDAMAFQNSGLISIELPETLTSIGAMAFSNTKLSGDLTLPAAVEKIGAQAFANNDGITGMNLGAAVSSVGDGFVMACPNLLNITVDAANENYQAAADGSYLQTKDGKTLVAYAPACTAESLTGNYLEIAPYAMYGATNVKSVNFPAANIYGDYCLYGAGLTAASLRGSVGRYVTAHNTAMTTLNLGTAELPTGVAEGNVALTEVTVPEVVTVVKQDAFKGCTALKSLKLGGYLAILEADCFAGAGIEALEVASTFPAAMAEGVFTPESNITATVPAALVEDYKAAEGWKYLNIVGDANLAAQGADMGMPAGLYYAGDDDMLHCAYADGQFDTYDIGGVPHTFQLLEYSNRIYGASAGRKFIYSATGATDGDGKLFYISKVGGEIFQAVVLDNTGNNAYKDPFGLYLYGQDLYVNDRNVCIRVIPASAIALPQNYPSWMENNWMGFYGQGWSYGCIKCGFAITETTDAEGNPEPLYWVGMKFNGNGIFRFREKDIYPEGDAILPAEAPYLQALNPLFTTFNVDVPNGHLYLYIEKLQDGTPAGLYRVNLADLEANPNPTSFAALNPVLIDGSPVKYEGGGVTEHVGISQLAYDANHQYLYWCYRAPEDAEEAAKTPDDVNGRFPWAEEYDANNPLHHSGIKRIKLGEAQPTVEMVVPGVTGYGLAVVNYEGSTKPESGLINSVVSRQPNLARYAAGAVTANEDVEIVLYAANGLMIGRAKLAAGESYSVANLEAGVYIVAIQGATTAQTLKIAK